MAKKKSLSNDNKFFENEGVNNSQDSLFGIDAEQTGNGLDICYCKFLEFEHIGGWHQLFEGFSNIRVVTFSSSASMITKMLRELSFEKFEVIFGNFKIFKELDMMQELLIETQGLVSALTGRNSEVAEFLKGKILSGNLKINIAKPNSLSHEKIYIMWNGSKENPENFRVVVGSANMSIISMEGKQKENIEVFDNDMNAYFHFQNRFDNFLEDSLQTIEPDALSTSTIDDLINNNIVIKNIIEQKNTVYIEEKLPDDNEEVSVIYTEDVEKTKDILNKLKMESVLSDSVVKEKNLWLVKPEQIVKVKKEYRNRYKKFKEKLEHFPEMYIDSNLDIFVNNDVMNLETDDDNIRNDVKIFKDFFEGYHNGCFDGEVDRAIEKYYASVVYAFISPFFHYCIKKTGSGIDIYEFPCFLILRGPKSAGKTPFFSFLLKLMFNEYGFNCEETGNLIRKSGDMSPQKDLVPAMLSGKGFPILVDELTRDRAKDYEETFKNPRLFLQEYCSCVMFTCNDDFEISDYSLKRSVLFNINMTNNHSKSGKLNSVVSNAGNLTGDLYKEFLHRFIDKFVDYLEELDELKIKSRENRFDLTIPDIFVLGSTVLKSIFDDYEDGRECKCIKIYDRYFYRDGLSNLEERKKAFMDDYYFGVWQVDTKHNALVRKFEGMSAQRKAKEFADSMNQGYNISVSGDTVRIKLEWASHFFNYDFKVDAEKDDAPKIIVQEKIVEKIVEKPVVQEVIKEVEVVKEIIKEPEKPKGFVDKLKFVLGLENKK
ncbi:MAG: hypothetical protein Q4D21_02870 [Phascolarctobacterium sp.]|nr:hypothetical protein [Phascolarctobacterium sp.]